ncbi:MAG: dependent oxidoreductase, partial [Acidimicrobiales bacterium]|nr:dependent oxidoreductase [Acidimicrobiales bacterium]
MRSLSLWHDTLPADDTMSPRSPLPGDLDVDVAIVGAGYTGLWTAHYLRAADPTLRIAVVDKHVAGFGASGRNGGWASAILPMSLDTIAKGAGGGDTGREAAIRMQREMYRCVDEVGRAAAELGIDCHYAKGGQLDFVRNPAQVQRARGSIEHAAAYGLDDVRWLETAEMAEHGAASNLLGGVYTPHCAVIHPARLARGLAA